MKALKDYQGRPLAWVQPGALSHVYELKTGDEVAARLEWPNGLGSPASAKCADGEWALQRQGFIRPRVTIRAAAAGEDAAVFEPGWSGSGEITLASGARLRLVPANLWRSEWRLLSPKGQVLLRLRPDTGLVRTTARLEIEPEGAATAELPALAFLAWSVLVLMEDDLAVYGV